MLKAVLLATMVAALPSLARADAAGSALGVKQQAAAQLSGDTRILRVGSDIFIGDLVETGPQGQVQILFADNTELVLGPSSALTIEDYLIRNDGSAGKLAVDILSGAFRFATGDSAKNRYTIGTPTGTIGVRGTEFDGWVDPAEGVSYVIRHGGTVILCSNANECELLDDVCEVGRIASSEVAVLGDSRQSQGDQRALYKGLFPYTDNQAPLLRPFWFAAARDCLNASPTGPTQPDDDTSFDDDFGNDDKPDPVDPVVPPPCTGRNCQTP